MLLSCCMDLIVRVPHTEEQHMHPLQLWDDLIGPTPDYIAGIQAC